MGSVTPGRDLVRPGHVDGCATGPHERLHDVADIDEVERFGAGAADGRGRSGDHCAAQTPYQIGGAAGTLAGTVDVRQGEADGCQPICVRVGTQVHFAGQFSGGAGGNSGTARHMRRRVDDPLYTPTPARLAQVDGAQHVASRVELRVVNRGVRIDLCGEVENDVWIAARDDSRELRCQ